MQYKYDSPPIRGPRIVMHVAQLSTCAGRLWLCPLLSSPFRDDPPTYCATLSSTGLPVSSPAGHPTACYACHWSTPRVNNLLMSELDTSRAAANGCGPPFLAPCLCLLCPMLAYQLPGIVLLVPDGIDWPTCTIPTSREHGCPLASAPCTLRNPRLG